MPGSLSPREAQILGLVAEGLTSKAIAGRLAISESTVNWHLSNVLRKLGASSRAEAVAIAMRDGQLGAGDPLRARPRPEDMRSRRPLLAVVTTVVAVTTVVLATLGISAALLSSPRPPAVPTPLPSPGATTSPAIRSEQPTATPTIPPPSATASFLNVSPPVPLASAPALATPWGTVVPLAVPTVVAPPGPGIITALPTPIQAPALSTPALPTPLPIPPPPTLPLPDLDNTRPPLPVSGLVH